MPLRIVLSAPRHARWWLDWHTRPGPGAGCRKLNEVDLVPSPADAA